MLEHHSATDFRQSLDAITPLEALRTELPSLDERERVDAQVTAHGRQVDLPLTAEQRRLRFILVCRDAASLEASRRAAGLSEPQPAPWPASTWLFLAEQTRRARAAT